MARPTEGGGTLATQSASKVQRPEHGVSTCMAQEYGDCVVGCRWPRRNKQEVIKREAFQITIQKDARLEDAEMETGQKLSVAQFNLRSDISSWAES